MATYINLNDTQYTISQIRAMRKAELVDHVMGLANEINRLNAIVRDMEAVTATKKPATKKPATKKPATKKPVTKNWKNVSPENIHAKFRLAGVTETMQRRATFALNRGDSPTAVADYAVGTNRNKRWEKIRAGATKARA